MLKSGAVYAKRFPEWFQPYNTNHLSAYLTWKATGSFPAGFIPDTVWFPAGWPEEIENMISGVPICKEAIQHVDEFKRISDLVGRINMPGYEFVVSTLGDHFAVQVKYMEADVVTKVMEEQVGRMWVFPSGQTDDQIVNTCFKAVLTSVEHRTREHFALDSVPVMYPHRNMSALVEITRSHVEKEKLEAVHPRSSEWPKVRDAYLKDHPTCIVCGTTKHMTVHHIKPFHLFPKLELDPTNFATMCESPSHNCHFFMGHFFNWEHYNPRVLEMSAEYKKGLEAS